VGLAFSLAAVIIIALWVDNELDFNRWYKNSKNLYVTCSNSGFTGIPLPLIQTLHRDFPEIKRVTNFTNDENVILYKWEDGINGFNELGAYVDSTIFEMLDINLLRGSAQSVFQLPFSVVLSESMAKKFFGKEDPIGKTLRVDNYDEAYQITGIFREQPKNSSFQFQWLMPFEVLTTRSEWDPVNGRNLFRCIVELNPNIDVIALNDKIVKVENTRTNRNNNIFLYPITQIHLYGEFLDGKPIESKRVREIKEISFIAFIILLIGIICAVMSGIYPAFYISAFTPVDIMKKLKNNSSNNAAWVRKGLVIVQFAASFVLICVTIAIVMQIRLGQHRPLGYDKEHLLRVRGISRITPQSVISDELAKSALVKSAAFANDPLVINGSTSGGFQWHGKSDDVNPTIHRSHVSTGYIETIGFKLLEGRSFYEKSEADVSSIIINKTLADIMGDEGRINNELWQGSRDRAIIYTIVGIIDDYICNDIYRAKSAPLMLFYDRGSSPLLYVRLNSQAEVGSAMKMIQSTLSQFPSDRPLDYAFVDDLVNRMFDSQRQKGFLVALFSVLSVLISCLGLFGLITYIAESKTKDIGIRKILGASVGNLVAMLTKEFLILVTISSLLAIPLAYYWIDKMLQDYEYRISIGLGLFATAILITMALTIITVGWQARKAATANPVNALQIE